MSVTFLTDEDAKEFVKSVNGKTPDENGNVEIAVSGGVAVTSVEPAEDDIPKVFITGVKPTTKDDVFAEMQYISKTDKFHAFLNIKCQGTSSMNYPKKNFTVKLYSDEARETKLKKDFKDWNHPGNKFVLKANYIDHSHARNIVSARLWNEVVKSRPDYDSLPEEMQNSPRNGAVDGFPIKVYYNGTYEGVYTWNIGKDDWQWGMDEDNPSHVLLCAETNTNGNKTATPCNFRALWNGVHESHWSVEVGTNSTAVKTSLNNLIQFVMDNDGDDFRNGIGTYLDIQSAIDYYIFQYEVCGLDGLAKNMLLATYDGTKWICGAYDLDSTFGMWWNGGSFVAATYACPEDYQEDYSLLWERIEANFLPELKARQAELRKTVLSYSNMVTHFERFMDVIGLDLYAEDLTVYTGIPSGSTNNIKQIRNYIRDRQAYVDAEFAAMSLPVACTGISLDKSTLIFTGAGTQTVTATAIPDGCTDAMVWVSSNPSIATISVDGAVCTVEAVANGNATITVTCGGFSASCSVAVSGMSEAVACTGITLDKTELAFDGGGTQTITASVTPADTTDQIIWNSNNTAVATVEDGVVTAIGNGSATITATCGNYSASCAVSVSGLMALLYNLPETTAFNGTSDYIDTGIKLFDTPKDFTILLHADFTQTNATNSAAFHCLKEASPYPGLAIQKGSGVVLNVNGTGGNPSAYASNIDQSVKTFVITASQGIVNSVRYKHNNEIVDVDLPDLEYNEVTQNLLIGSGQYTTGVKKNFWKGTMYDFKVYGEVLSEEAIMAYFEQWGCVSVILSADTLTFTDTATQVLTATTAPEMHNDTLVWESSNESIAVVNDGTVWPISGGTCDIVATCGDEEATCEVNVSTDEALYPLKNGTYESDNYTVTVTNGNRVRVEITGSVTNLYFNLSEHLPEFNYTSERFTLKNGDVITRRVAGLRATPIPASTNIGLSCNYMTASGELALANSNIPFSNYNHCQDDTLTLTADYTVGPLCMYIGKPCTTGAVYEFVVSINVNGVKYV